MGSPALSAASISRSRPMIRSSTTTPTSARWASAARSLAQQSSLGASRNSPWGLGRHHLGGTRRHRRYLAAAFPQNPALLIPLSRSTGGFQPRARWDARAVASMYCYS